MWSLWGCCSYTYTAADVKQMLAEKKARGSTRMNIAAEKARLLRHRDHAQEVGNLNDVDRYAFVLYKRLLDARPAGRLATLYLAPHYLR